MSANQFRRKQRVRVTATGELGFICNPKPWYGRVSVRLDKQQPRENGYTYNECELEEYTGSDDQFNMRRYDLPWLSHNEVDTLISALNNEGSPEAAELLKKMPRLP